MDWIRHGLALAVALALLAFAGSPAANAGRPKSPPDRSDLELTSMTGPRHVTVGQTFLVRAIATNRGPATSALFVWASTSASLEIESIDCNYLDGTASGGADGSICELDNVPPGAYTTTVAHVRALDASGRGGTVTACADSDGQAVDPHSRNDCRTVHVAIADGSRRGRSRPRG